MLISKGNLALTYKILGRYEEALRLQRDVYSGWLKLKGEAYVETLREANNYASLLDSMKRFKEVKALLRRTIPVARRVLGDSNEFTLKMRWIYAEAIYYDEGATLDNIREAVTTLEDAERIARRVLGGAHPITKGIHEGLRRARAALHARETPSRGSPN